MNTDSKLLNSFANVNTDSELTIFGSVNLLCLSVAAGIMVAPLNNHQYRITKLYKIIYENIKQLKVS